MTADTLEQLDAILANRANADPAASYTAGLHAAGVSRMVEKIDEEAGEVRQAAVGDDNGHLVREVADLWFHCMVLLHARGSGSDAVVAELGARLGVSGIDEKAARR